MPELTIDRSACVGPVRRRLFGSFVEHLGRCVYDGIYEPGHPTADEDGFRGDVLELVRELGVSTVRYPGGNFVSGYRWEDGVGPRAQRPVRLDLAWHSVETNQIGIDEFARWASRAELELMLAVNLGTRGTAEALDLLEYVNHPSGTALSESRRAHGAAEPYGVRMWCLGNEMDGPWQVGHRSAEEYGAIASRTAAAMRMFDPGLELVACGSSSASMPTFGEWERVVLEHCYEHIDYISCHAYYQERGGDLDSFLATSLELEGFIDAVVAAIDHVRHRRRAGRTVAISFDEWNIWYLDEHQASAPPGADWPRAPRLLEDVYTALDAVVLGGLLISLLKRSDRVHAACLAQLVNVIAPIMTEPGGPAWRQTTFFPFALTSRLARGAVLRPHISCGDYETARHGTVPLIDAVATHDAEASQAAVFLINRDRHGAQQVHVDLRDLGVSRIVAAQTLTHTDLHARNTLRHPDTVTPVAIADATLVDGRLTLALPPASWGAVALTGRVD